MSSSPTKKILYIITKSNYGGAQKYVYELAVGAKQAGHLVRVACGGTGEAGAAPGLLITKLSEAHIPTDFIPHFTRDMSLRDDIKAFFEIIRVIRKERPDILHVTSSKAGGLGALAGRLCGVSTIVFTSHGLSVDETWRPYWQRILIYLSTWATFFFSDRAIMISTETFLRAQRMPLVGKKTTYIKNGIAPISFLSKAEAQKALNITLPASHVLIGGIGELHQNKNWHTLIQTTASFPNHVHLAIIGSGEDHDSLVHHIEKYNVTNRVHLLGYHKDAAVYLKAFDIFVLPSKKEGLPYVLLEAGLAELPVIASDLPGNRDIIEPGTHGFLVTPEPKLLSTTIEMLLRDDGMRRRFGSALYTRVTTVFSLQAMIQDTLNCYESKISRD